MICFITDALRSEQCQPLVERPFLEYAAICKGGPPGFKGWAVIVSQAGSDMHHFVNQRAKANRGRDVLLFVDDDLVLVPPVRAQFAKTKVGVQVVVILVTVANYDVVGEFVQKEFAVNPAIPFFQGRIEANCSLLVCLLALWSDAAPQQSPT